ncbi:MAG: hypothetical protein IPM29_06075 [Planctomycetes bacterium]|nr:hypothetical protein [Planctomycetota bacterium]
MTCARAAAALATLGLAGAVAAQVAAITTVTAPVAAELRTALPAGVRIDVVPPAALWRDVRAGRLPDCDLLLLVDLQLAALAGRRGLLRPRGVTPPPGAAPLYADPSGRYAVPCAERWLCAWDTRRMTPAEAPRSVAALGEVWLRARAALCSPEVAPSVFVEMLRVGLVQGGERLAFTALRDVDRSARAWVDTPAAAAELLRAEPEVWVGVLPASLADRLPAPPFASAPFEPLPVLQGLAVAVAAVSARDATELAPALEWALSPALALRLAQQCGLAPGLPRAELERAGGAPLPAAIHTDLANAPPLEPEGDALEVWVDRFASDVRGRAESAADRLFVIELAAFALLIAVTVWFARRTRTD